MPSPGAVATAACSATPVHDPPGAQAPDEHPARQAGVEPVAAQRMVQLCVAVQPSPFALQVSTEPPFELQRMSVPALQTTSRQRPPSHTLPVPQGWFCQLAPELSQTCESVAST